MSFTFALTNTERTLDELHLPHWNVIFHKRNFISPLYQTLKYHFFHKSNSKASFLQTRFETSSSPTQMKQGNLSMLVVVVFVLLSKMFNIIDVVVRCWDWRFNDFIDFVIIVVLLSKRFNIDVVEIKCLTILLILVLLLSLLRLKV